MSDPKPLASLSPTLLARKGAARPAMRPQWQPMSNYSNEVPAPPSAGLEDLGWNDMGEPHPVETAPEPKATEPAQPAPVVVPFGAPDETFAEPLTTGVPEVVRQQDTLAETVATEPPPLIPLAAHRYARSAPPAPAPGRRAARDEGRRAAFTLRVDEARHLKLRLACTVQGRSAQQIVTEALDRLLDELPELDDLARRVKRH
jgi:hypothetical protein